MAKPIDYEAAGRLEDAHDAQLNFGAVLRSLEEAPEASIRIALLSSSV
jgi:hypothetical protein